MLNMGTSTPGLYLIPLPDASVLIPILYKGTKSILSPCSFGILR